MLDLHAQIACSGQWNEWRDGLYTLALYRVFSNPPYFIDCSSLVLRSELDADRSVPQPSAHPLGHSNGLDTLPHFQ